MAPMSEDDDSQERPRGVYWLPNLLTTGAMFAGFYAIVAAIDLKFENAGIAVFVAGMFDMLDGRVARWTNTASAFGKEYDSLSDMVSFGVAPAIVTYQWGVARIAEYGPLWRRVGWLVCFFYAAAAALRLARFNSRATQDKHYFEGLPSPAAAAIVASLVWLASDRINIGLEGLVLAFVVIASSGALMVSRFAFNSFKQVNASARVRFRYVVLVLLAVVLIGAFRAAALLLIFGGYALSAPTVWLFRKLRRRNRPSPAPPAFITPPLEPPAPVAPVGASAPPPPLEPGEPPVAHE
jgi:CDP-diacylglycerol---serine O-phosphatidyltransferase